jgi:hypothetical protein
MNSCEGVLGPVSAMCRKCLRSASEDARRCVACGGHLVRFNDTGQVVEIEVAGEEPSKTGGGIPALFADLEEQLVPVPSVPNHGGSFAQPQLAGAALSQGYSHPANAG